MRVLVFGGRNFEARGLLYLALDELHETLHFTCVIHGKATGADRYADLWARSRGVPVEPYEADWAGWGKVAGRMRNARMLREGKPELGVGCPGGRGTAHMKMLLKQAGIRVVEVGQSH